MRKEIIFFFCVMMKVLCQGQNVITGTLRSTDNIPVDFANIVLLAQVDSTFLTGTVSGVDGGFSLAIPANVDIPCVIRITNIGYKTICQSAYPGNVGVIQVESDTQMLGEIIVKADLPVTRLKGDAMVTNIDGTVLAKTGTAQAMLDYIPGVASQKGVLEVLGRGIPAVYINGRLMRDVMELERLSSEDILSVEVINNPGARYDASVNAVIRIQTKKTVGDGIGFNNRIYAGYNKKWNLLEQIDVNYRQGGLDVFGMLYLERSPGWQNMSIVQDTYLDKHWQQKIDAGGKWTHRNLMTNLGMNYMFNENHSVGFKYNLDRYPGGKTNTDYSTKVFEGSTFFEETQSLSIIKDQETEHSVNLYYNGARDNWKIDFNTDLLWTKSDENTDIQEWLATQKGTLTERQVSTYSNIHNKLYASKLVFSYSVFSGEFVLGGEFSHTNRNTDYRNPQGILANDVSEIKENNVAAFTEYSRELGHFQLHAGFRYEHTAFNYYEERIRQNEQSKRYDEFFPSVSIGTSVGKMNMQLSYTQDISRPNFHSLRSTVYYVNRYTYETGNPFLMPTITHNVGLMSAYKWWQFYVSYQQKKDEVMFTMMSYSDDDPNLSLIKPINIKSYDIAYARLTATPTIGVWSPRFTLSFRKQWFDVESPEGKKNLNRPQVAFRWQNSLKLPAGFLFGLGSSWYSKYDHANSRFTKASYAVDASLNKGFFSDRLTCQLNAYDIFLTRRYVQQQYYNEMYTFGKVIEPDTRRLSFTVRYRFNQAKDKYKGTGAGESQKNRL